MDAEGAKRMRSTATYDEIIRRLDALDDTLRERVERIEVRVSDHEKRITRIETLFDTITQRFDGLERLIELKNGLEERQWKIIIVLLVIIGLLTGGIEAAKLLANLGL